MDDPDRSPLVSSTSAAGQPQPPLFQYQFVRDEEEDDDEEDEEEEVDDEQLEVRERKPAAPAPASAPAAPLRDSGVAAERPPPAPQPAWTSHPAPSAPFAFPDASEFSLPEEKEKEPPRSAPLPPPPAPPHGEEPRAPAVPPRSAPLPPKREEPPAAGKTAASRSPDETLFALPVASEPLMHSPSDKGMNLQEQLGRACPASQEDFAAALLDATASLPSLSPTVSANPFKEYTALDAVSGGLSADSRYSQIEGETFKATTKSAQNPFLADGAGEVAEQKSSEEVPPFTATEPFFLSQTKEPKGTKESFDIEKFSMYQQDSSPESPVELFAKRDKDVPLDRQHDIDDQAGKVSFRDDPFAKDEYADFKPFEPPGAGDKSSSLKDVPRNEVDGKLGSGIDKYDAEVSNPLPIEKNFEKESGSSNEDISFPSTPDAPEEPSQAYVTCTKFESAVATEGSAAKTLPLVEEQPSENKTDEKKIAEMKAHLVTEPSSTHIELASGLGQKADTEKSEDLLKKLAASAAAANVPEGLTPDLVQEVYESELHDAVSPKLAYETKMDLVQTSESSQEPLHASVQLCPSFEAESEAAPSPVLPDIVMEAPLNASTVGMGGPTIQLETSPLETFTVAGDYENAMLKSEKPPSYQEAMNVPAAQTQETKAEAAEKKPDDKKDETPEDLETSYISIACDLVKETKVSNESALTGFVDYPKAERVSQAVPEPPEHLEKTPPPSGKSDSFSHQPEIELAQKKIDDVKEKPLETANSIVSKGAEEQKREEVPLSLGKPYLESFQPQVEPSKNVPPAWSLEAEAADLAKKEKTAQLRMEELNAYEDDFPVSEEPKVKDKIVLSAESSPETDDFPTIPYQAAKLVTGATEKVELKENESRESCDMVKMEPSQPPYQEVAQDLSLKNVHVKIEERELALGKPSEKLDREVPEAAKEPLPPADVTPLPAQKKVVSVDKEAERRAASVKEKEKTVHVFSSKLSKPSVVDLLYWRDIKKTGVVFGASLFLLLSLTVFSIVSVVAYIALALLSVTISFRIYKGVIQAIQKSDEGHPFRDYLDKDVAVSEELVQKYSHVVLGHINSTVKELRRLFLVDDLVDSLKFAVLMWVFTYVGALFNGLTLLILALISLFSIPVIYEKHQAQIDHYVGLVNKNVKDAVAKVQAKIPGLKRKVE